ncbi:MAG TPA: enoyl-CoA hydratase/isomerase family protein [Caulobacteraceae bacterium]|nr:enoyl-CoA hydratase/isomerase family protein [Caulobacteraceae bacterium]
MTDAPTFETLVLTVRDGIAVLTLNRPKVRNAIDDVMRLDLKAAIDHIGGDRAIRGLVLTGAGAAFCSGGDIRGMQERLEQGARAGELGWWRQREFHESLTKLYNLGVPTLAAVNGPAFGLGLDVALTCDFVWLADDSEVAVNFVRRGLVSDGGGFFHLPRRVGVAKAKELFFSGRTISAEEALALGVADKLLPAGELVAKAIDFLKGFAEHPATAQAMAKSILNRTFELSFEQVNVLASEGQAFCYSSADHQNSIREFFEERERARKAKGQ